MDYFEVDNLGKKIFETCLKYVNTDLKTYCGKELFIEYKTGIEKKRINAEAKVTENNNYVVTVEMATYIELDKFYRTMLYQPGFFKMLAYQDEYDEKLAEEVCVYLFQYTVKLIIFHELGHIFNGHVDYIKMRKTEKSGNNESSFALRENCKVAEDILSAKEWQALEWNADDFAATRIVGQTAFKDNLELFPFIKGKEHAVFLDIVVVIAMYTMMGMSYESTEKEKQIYNKKAHLPYRFRAMKLVETMLLAFERFYYKIDIDPILLQAIQMRIEKWAIQYMINIKEVDKNEWKTDSNSEEIDNEHYTYYDDIDIFYRTIMFENIKQFSKFPLSEE